MRSPPTAAMRAPLMRRGAASEVLVEGRLWIPATVPLVVGGEADTDATPATALGAVSTPATAFALLVPAVCAAARAPPPGDQTSTCHVPLEFLSKLDPEMWKRHTCGSLSGSSWPSPWSLMIFTVPLLPDGSAYAGVAPSMRSPRLARNAITPATIRMFLLRLSMKSWARALASSWTQGPLHIHGLR